jgi:hypothetical protein
MDNNKIIELESIELGEDDIGADEATEQPYFSLAAINIFMDKARADEQSKLVETAKKYLKNRQNKISLEIKSGKLSASDDFIKLESAFRTGMMAIINEIGTKSVDNNKW